MERRGVVPLSACKLKPPIARSADINHASGERGSPLPARSLKVRNRRFWLPRSTPEPSWPAACITVSAISISQLVLNEDLLGAPAIPAPGLHPFRKWQALRRVCVAIHWRQPLATVRHNCFQRDFWVRNGCSRVIVESQCLIRPTHGEARPTTRDCLLSLLTER